jgi:hypothetical protein
MISITIVAAFALNGSGAPAPMAAPLPVAAQQEGAARVPATREKATAFLGSSFDAMDRDRCGFLDASEAPRVTVKVGAQDGPMVEQPLSRAQASARWLARNDGDRDGKVSEFVVANRAMIEAAGLPARWKPRS